MRTSKKLLKFLCKFHGINSELFEYDEEFRLAEAILTLHLTDENIAALEELVTQCRS